MGAGFAWRTGTYELLPFLNLSGQLSRRSVHIHFPRYRSETKADRRSFIDAMWTLQHHLPVQEVEDISQTHADLIYEWTLGCVGIAKELFARACAVALEEGDRAIALTHLKQYALSEAQRERMIKEILAGEEQLSDNHELRARIRALLRLDGPPQTANGNSPLVRGKPNGRKIGHRKPVRDPVGVQHAG